MPPVINGSCVYDEFAHQTCGSSGVLRVSIHTHLDAKDVSESKSNGMHLDMY